MKVFLKGLNSCTMRRKNVQHYGVFLEKNGHQIVNDPIQADRILFWTCGFRQDVADASLDTLEYFENNRPGSVVALGCLPGILREKISERFSGTIIPWRDEPRMLEELFGRKGFSFTRCEPVFAEHAICSDIETYRHEHPQENVTFHDQFAKLVISEGCPFDCAYCTERLAFPPYRSITLEKIQEATRQLVKAEQKRIALTADCLGAYGQDFGYSLPVLIRSLHNLEGEMVFALNNLHPIHFLQFREEFEEFIQKGWIEHINLPIQSASDQVLAKMERGYTRVELEEMKDTLNRLGFTAFDTHVIVGFPGETEEDFDQTISFILNLHPRYILLSRYYESPAAQSALLLEKVPLEVVKKRIERGYKQFVQEGIICNYEGGEFGLDRIRRIKA